MSRTIAIANQKGGCGKTTVSINLAASLAFQNQNVLLIDLDPQGHASLGLGCDIEKLEAGMYDVLAGKKDGSISISDITQKINDNLDLAPTNSSLNALEELSAGKVGREFLLKNRLKPSKKLYEYIIIDCPPNLGLLTFNALLAAEELIIPFESSLFSFQGVGKLLESVTLLKEELGHKLDYYILFSMFENRTRFSRELLRKTIVKYKGKVLNNKINYTVKLKEAAGKGKPITSYRSKESTAFKDFYSLAREVQKLKILSNVHRDFYNMAREIQDLKMLTSIHKMKLDFSKFQFPLKLENGAYFALQNEKAADVHIVGDFNNWEVNGESKLNPDGFGGWRKYISLSPGTTYRYKFLIDGEWKEDHMNPAQEPSSDGGFNSVIEM